MQAEFIALSKGLHYTIPLMGLIAELQYKGRPTLLCQQKIHCRVSKDDNGA